MSTLSQMIDVLIACANNIAEIADTALDALSGDYLHFAYSRIAFITALR